jgi:hypothetical protein
MYLKINNIPIAETIQLGPKEIVTQDYIKGLKHVAKG